MEVPAGADGLSPNQHVDVYRFLQRYRREAIGRLVIAVPASARDQAAIAQSLQDIQRHVAEAGIDYRIARGARGCRRPSTPLDPARLPAAGGGAARLRSSGPRTSAATRSAFPIRTGAAPRSATSPLMVDNARDLQQPQDEDPRSSERRSVTWSSYVGVPASGGESNAGGSADASKKGPAAKK